MKITRSQLKRIIQEELQQVMMEQDPQEITHEFDWSREPHIGSALAPDYDWEAENPGFTMLRQTPADIDEPPEPPQPRDRPPRPPHRASDPRHGEQAAARAQATTTAPLEGGAGSWRTALASIPRAVAGRMRQAAGTRAQGPVTGREWAREYGFHSGRQGRGHVGATMFNPAAHGARPLTMGDRAARTTRGFLDPLPNPYDVAAAATARAAAMGTGGLGAAGALGAAMSGDEDEPREETLPESLIRELTEAVLAKLTKR